MTHTHRAQRHEVRNEVASDRTTAIVEVDYCPCGAHRIAQVTEQKMTWGPWAPPDAGLPDSDSPEVT